MGRFGDSAIGVFERVPLRKIRHSRKMVREGLGDFTDLMTSIKEVGLLEPLVVRPVGNFYEVVAGNRRLESCKMLHMKRVACHIVVMDDVTSYEEALVENLQRRMMNPVEEALAFKKYIDDYGFGGISQLARKIGKSQSYVSRRVALLGLPAKVRKKMEDGRLSSVIAQELLPLDRADAASIADLMIENDYSREDVRSLARAVKQKRGPGDWLGSVPMAVRKRPESPAVDRILNKAMTNVRVCMMRTDDTIESLPDEEWLLKEVLLDYRRTMHAMIDRLVHLKLSQRKKTGLEWQTAYQRGRARATTRDSTSAH